MQSKFLMFKLLKLISDITERKFARQRKKSVGNV